MYAIRSYYGLSFTPSEVRVEIQSSGYGTGSGGYIKLNGGNVLRSSQYGGYGIAIIDSAKFSTLQTGIYDNYHVVADRDSIRRIAENVQFGQYIMVATADEPRSASNQRNNFV